MNAISLSWRWREEPPKCCHLVGQAFETFAGIFTLVSPTTESGVRRAEHTLAIPGSAGSFVEMLV